MTKAVNTWYGGELVVEGGRITRCSTSPFKGTDIRTSAYHTVKLPEAGQSSTAPAERNLVAHTIKRIARNYVGHVAVRLSLPRLEGALRQHGLCFVRW